MIIVGIDPGKAGGVALLTPAMASGYPMPLVGKDIDGRYLTEWLGRVRPNLVIIEKVGAARVNGRPQGGTSMFTFGTGFGKLLGVLEALNTPHRLVTPQTWKATVLKGTKKDKAAAIDFVHRAYPSVELMPGRCSTPQDGIADAVCLAEYGRQLVTQQSA